MLTDPYRPLTVDAFVGLEKLKAVLGDLLVQPGSKALLLYGESGIGKTAMGQAIAWRLGACERNGTYLHIPARKCGLEAVAEMAACMTYPPLYGSWYVILVDEVNLMTLAAQDAWLSVLDATEMPFKTLLIFTCNEGPKTNAYLPENLTPRFLSRLIKIHFSNYKLNGDGSKWLRFVRQDQGGGKP